MEPKLKQCIERYFQLTNSVQCLHLVCALLWLVVFVCFCFFFCFLYHLLLTRAFCVLDGQHSTFSPPCLSKIYFSRIYIFNILTTDRIWNAKIWIKNTGVFACVSAVLMQARMMPKQIEFKADKPFLYYIYEHKSKTALFLGTMSNPGSYPATKDEL